MDIMKIKIAINRMTEGVKSGEITLDQLEKFINEKMDDIDLYIDELKAKIR
jgi:hypothetical protein